MPIACLNVWNIPLNGIRDIATSSQTYLGPSEGEVLCQVCKTTTEGDGSGGNSYESPLRSGFLSLVAQYASKLANDDNFAAALHGPDLQEMFADTFRALGKMIAEV